MRGQRGSCAGWSGRSGHAGGKNEVALRVVNGIFQRALLRQVGGVDAESLEEEGRLK